MRRIVSATLAGVLLLGWTPAGLGGSGRTSLHRSLYRNSVLDRNFPDPTVIRATGRYYAYATQSGSLHIQVSHSRDLVHWTHPREALPKAPRWSRHQGIFWAPHVIGHRGTFYLYYSAAPDRSDIGGAICLAVATARKPQGPFTDVGKPLYCGDTGSDIDAALFHARHSDRWFVYWGSGGDIVVARLSRDLVSLHVGSFPKRVLRGWSARVHRPYEHGIEGPWVIYRRGWYYLFYSGNKCCEYPPHYAPMVARSRRPKGPFSRLRPTIGPHRALVLRSNRRWAGPGHNSVISDARGHRWFVYHAIDRRDPYGKDGGVRRVMLIDRVRFEHGWPVVGRGTPSRGRRAGPATRY